MASAQPADLVLTNARVLTMDPAQPEAQAVAIGAGRIVAVGSNDAMLAWQNGTATARDLAGGTLLPGFYDSHNHMLMTGLSQTAVDLSGANSIEAVLDAIAQGSAQML